MSFNIRIIDSNFVIPYDYLDNAYDALCELNAHDDLKSGGVRSGELSKKPQDSTSVSNNPNKWFSGMEWNYDETCKSVEDIMHALGFETEILQSGDLEIVGFKGEMGDEDFFLEDLAPFVEDGSYIEWINDDDLVWKYTFLQGDMEICLFNK